MRCMNQKSSWSSYCAKKCFQKHSCLIWMNVAQFLSPFCQFFFLGPSFIMYYFSKRIYDMLLQWCTQTTCVKCHSFSYIFTQKCSVFALYICRCENVVFIWWLPACAVQNRALLSLTLIHAHNFYFVGCCALFRTRCCFFPARVCVCECYQCIPATIATVSAAKVAATAAVTTTTTIATASLKELYQTVARMRINDVSTWKTRQDNTKCTRCWHQCT